MTDVSERFEVVFETSDNQHYSVRPGDIYVGQGCLLSTFGRREIEQQAEYLVRFFQHRGFWSGFSLQELTDFYREHGWDEEQMLEGLVKPWFHEWHGWISVAKPYIMQNPDGQHCVTNLFIERCMAAVDPPAYLR